MSYVRRSFFTIAVGGLALAAGCSKQPDAPVATDAQAPAADESAKKLATYQQLLKIHNDQLAVQLGKEIVDKYPGSAAATEVGKTLPALESSWKEASEKARLTNLWQYQIAPMQGGTQSTATIYNSQPSGDDRVRLVLRRHTDWGQTVFLYGSGKGFQCAGDCSLPATFDGKAKGLKGFSPPTGEPALILRNDAAFLVALQKTKRLTIDVTTKTRGKQTLVFEVGGYDASKWAPLPKKK
ncbi:hypothetical protein EC912_10829 [Luteibacter rhizovicinus]|uniref:Lipoprotein n=1 Tax=Luteibacter rhizovicinus TaxID=242606 RepID=A0A4R3YKV2_9GAMM|nr:hypothetical protein [Luteibacter rhizovicinus]TCV92038.1 hypothetical protein EC912_10829 [Luteibacter rhizovicinus]